MYHNLTSSLLVDVWVLSSVLLLRTHMVPISLDWAGFDASHFRPYNRHLPVFGFIPQSANTESTARQGTENKNPAVAYT